MNGKLFRSRKGNGKDSSMACEENVFVYGTLRRGASNHELIRRSPCSGLGRTVEPYALYVGRYPYAVRRERTIRIRGEVYRVDVETMARLDELEQHPEVYRREQVDIELDGGEILQAWLYFYPAPEGEPLPSGDYADWPGAGVI
jgi:gamma-glutamylcyclotransferase (GGCT)/AIG2-like uncharacterized protein YtfP